MPKSLNEAELRDRNAVFACLKDGYDPKRTWTVNDLTWNGPTEAWLQPTRPARPRAGGAGQHAAAPLQPDRPYTLECRPSGKLGLFNVFVVWKHGDRKSEMIAGTIKDK